MSKNNENFPNQNGKQTMEQGIMTTNFPNLNQDHMICLNATLKAEKGTLIIV